ncbi:MAG: hypothetical protein LBU89_07530 [Fibromonadaceae bacterium]|jgi:hypothetical protein|nr:hypothetical protein [Fibromonadaceae bacterium]
MKKSEFETRLMVGIASQRLALLRESEARNLFYSSEMHEPEEKKKIYLLELNEETFILRSDLIFDDATTQFFYVTKEIYEYSEENLKYALFVLRRVEHRAYEILSKLNLRGYYSKKEFVRNLVHRMPQLELLGDAVKDRKSGKTFIVIKEEILHFAYKEGDSESYMNLAKKDFNERILQQCIEIITSIFKQEKVKGISK